MDGSRPPIRLGKLGKSASASQPREPRGHATTTLHASHGYEIVREYPLPDVTTKEDLNQLIGQKILYSMHGMMTQLMVGILAQFATLDLV